MIKIEDLPIQIDGGRTEKVSFYLLAIPKKWWMVWKWDFVNQVAMQWMKANFEGKRHA